VGLTVLSRIVIAEMELLSKQLEMVKLHVRELRGDDAGAGSDRE